MAPASLGELDHVVHEPTRAFVESTNVWQFMQTHDIDDYEGLIRRTTTDIHGLENASVEWFWDEIVDYLHVEFFEDYDRVRDDSEGPRFTDWYPGGELNAAHNAVDRALKLAVAERRLREDGDSYQLVGE